MRCRGLFLAMLAAVWLAGSSARAGTYLASEGFYFPETPQQAKFILNELRSAPVAAADGTPPDPVSLRHKYLDMSANLEAKERDGNLSTLDRIDLGGCYLRLRKFGDAARVLQAADQSHFMVLANLATAYFEMGELDRAVSYQDQALAAWPAVWAGWTPQQWSWNRRCERLFQALLRHRNEELRRAGGKPGPARTVDSLFPKLRFGANGRYEAGPLPLLWDELPQDAHRAVLQLMIWLPFEDRLKWLFAELLNVIGDVEGAFRQMDDLVFNRDWSNVEELKRHRQILKQARQEREVLDLNMQTSLLWTLAPRGIIGFAGLGDAVQECAWPAADFLARKKAHDDASPFPTGDAPPTSAILPSGPPLAVGFGTGVLVTILGALQWRQWARRRAPNANQPAVSN